MPHPVWNFQDRGHLSATGRWRTTRPRHVQHAFLWPKDKQRTPLGRLADIFTGKGPDMFVSSNANRAVRASDGPTRARWTGFPSTDPKEAQLADANAWYGGMPWARGREERPFYDFETRRFRRRPFTGMAVNAVYMPHEKNKALVWQYPDFKHPYGTTQAARDNPEAYDPRNWGSNGVCYGEHGMGGSMFPPVDGFPPM